MDHRQLVTGAEVMYGELLVTGCHGARLLEPAYTALDHIASSILLGIERGRAALAASNLVASLGQGRADGVRAHPATDAPVAVAAIAGTRIGRLRGRPRRCLIRTLLKSGSTYSDSCV